MVEKMDSLSSLSDIYNLVIENCVKEYGISASARELWLDPLVPVEIKENKVILATDIDSNAIRSTACISQSWNHSLPISWDFL